MADTEAYPAFDPAPCVLQGRLARLEPLHERHADDLLAAGADAEIWRYMPSSARGTLDDVLGWIAQALTSLHQVPFAIVHRPSGRAVGSTRYGDIRRDSAGLEIGWTWIAPEHQRTGLNTECKLLLLSHAFDELGAERVQLKTDARNLRSQRAIERLGAVREGVLRRHIRMPDGFVRDTVMYSIVAAEWPAVRARLEAALAQGPGRDS